ncbi:MAG: SGNH/GDSL hydrolase family protein [Xanthomonadales bacterium]|nr:SGNH/GDSL hydrolase family protein [Xanthomonadales bacterium]
MKHIASALLSPLLLAQGVVTRATTLKLPEPPGARAGHAAGGQRLRLLIAGDSSAAGVGTAHQDQALAGRLTKMLEQHHALDWRLEAKTGVTTKTTIKRLSNLPPQPFDIALTSLGVNDVTSHRGVKPWLDDQQQLRQLLRQKFGVSMMIICGLPPVHGFPALPQPLRWHLGWRASLFDQTLQETLSLEPDTHFLSLRFTEDPDTMAEDGFHPGPRVYQEWARRAFEVIARHWPH